MYHLTVVSAANVWSCYTMPSLPCWRESHCVTRPNNGCKRDYTYGLSLTERKSNYSSTVSRLKNIIPSVFTAKSKLKLLYLQYTLTKDILQSSIRENEPEKRIIFWRRFLDWLLPILTLICPRSVCMCDVKKCMLFTRN